MPVLSYSLAIIPGYLAEQGIRLGSHTSVALLSVEYIRLFG